MLVFCVIIAFICNTYSQFPVGLLRQRTSFSMKSFLKMLLIHHYIHKTFYPYTDLMHFVLWIGCTGTTYVGYLFMYVFNDVLITFVKMILLKIIFAA